MHEHDHGHETDYRHEGHDHGHSHGGHGHGAGGAHGHTHGVVDPTIATTDEGIWAIKWSFVALFLTASLQLVVVILSGSVSLLADTIHNFGDAATAVPLWVAFALARRRPSNRFTFGYGRVEDLAGMLIVIIILFSAIVAAYESVERFFHPQDISHLWAVALASVVGFVGNEAVAIFRIRIGRRMRSEALIADGYHARVDGWTSLAVLGGVGAVWFGYPLGDPIIGLVITVAIFGIVIHSGRAIFTRALDGTDPKIIQQIRNVASHVSEVKSVGEVRARWLGHRLHVEANIAVDPAMNVRTAHDVASEFRHQLMHNLSCVSLAMVHVDPDDASGESHHSIESHTHDGLPAHSHA
jgi:cation diffusion facilitator family transporter